LAIVGALLGFFSSDAHLEPVGLVLETEFSEASIILEHNATDGDAEIVVFAKGGDKGLARISILAPDGTAVLDLSTQKRTLGLQKFSVETAEPVMSKVISAYPEGTYRFEGVTVDGVRLHSTTNLVHGLPSPPVITINKTEGKVNWTAVAGATGYSIEIEREVDGENVMKLTIDLPITSTSFSIPKVLFVPGEYKVGFAVRGKTGNIVVVEKVFEIGQRTRNGTHSDSMHLTPYAVVTIL
jgi:hypothetical protein